MATKISNQITFTELKKIIKIDEYYTTTKMPELQGNEVWLTSIPAMTQTNKYLWNYEETIYSIGAPDRTDPVVIGVYGEAGSSLQIKYISSVTVPVIVDNNVDEWSNEMPAQVSGENIYMTQKMSTDINWSTPIQISASNGEPPTMEIIDGYWYINGESTGVKAEGEPGKAPEITIGENGNWYIDGVDSGNKAQGEAGKDGANIEYVYYRSEKEVQLSVPSYTNGVLTAGWTASPKGITEVYKCEYVSVRNKPAGGEWGQFSAPVIWSKWGENGQDGDGVEYKYYLSNSSTAPEYSITDDTWTDDPTGVSVTHQYEYVVQIKTSNGTSIVSKPSLWAKFGEDGSDGRGISSITNYYSTTTSADVVPSSWELSAPELTPTNKYLWNYEYILYTDGSHTATDPAIIGVYGDSGSAITFEIYSTQGFMFKEDMNEIELKVAAFKGNDEITDATYTWKWWDASLNDGAGDYVVIIENTTEMSLVIHKGDQYALSSLQCVMLYDENSYEDYVTLTHETVIYSSVVKFFNGSNVFDSSSSYIAAYVELYKNNILIDSILTSRYYDGVTTVTGNAIVTDISGDFENGDLVYFIYNEQGKYNVALGEYRDGAWALCDVKSQYIYLNDLHLDSVSNVVIITKNEISKSREIDFKIYKNVLDGDGDYVYNDTTYVSTTSAIVIDINDPIVSPTEPTNANYGQLWLDTSVSPYVLKVYTKVDTEDTGKWVYFSQQNGGAVYTSKPEQYSAGDLWILAANETCAGFQSGTMLRATVGSTTFNADHWVDAMDISTTIVNIKESFTWDNSGIQVAKRVTDSNGKVTRPFYVHIDSERMGFHSVTYNANGVQQSDIEVVHIGNNSATIQNATFQGSEGTKFENQVSFEKQINMYKTNTTSGFVWKVEENGSLSLTIV